MMKKIWKLTLPSDRTQTVRQLIANWEIPKRYYYLLRQDQRILINGHYQSPDVIVPAGSQVTLTIGADDFKTRQAYVPDHHRQLPVLFENRDVVVINKPRGIKSHPNQPGETGTVMNYATAQFGTAYMVHRLDQQTSGAMMIAKHPLAVPLLNKHLVDHSIHRDYTAVVAGDLQGTGQITLPIGQHPTDPRKRQVDGLNAQPAITNYQVVAHSATKSIVELNLQTGRTHQIRVHLAALGHPILGDPLYHPHPTGPMQLHAHQLTLVLPFTHEVVQVAAPLPPDFTN
ncbi:RluA family pseudouridine synthase [Limosilactobacillus equigenerosi]|uniref:Pseudouridine synthase n=1 Tax=Limosilactobacillus equigenerosi DSM 18793 = JCM 14505 TaxID=1423742 RepID=A0A0R1UHY9_9LACO|nr:RluA family pseudouridine synthase [Limosilactobacillus equigenerosi]KRL92977.1 Pseudouridine synthase [Limosilactobacillus equigenerosi DSM 18793 = JCM 14505]